MKWMAFVIMAAMAAGLAGCGTAETNKGKTDDGNLKVTGPGDVTLKPGEKEKVSASVTWDGDEDVTVKLDDLPDGVEADQNSVKLKKGEKKAEFVLSLKAKEDKDVKEVTDHKVKVSATYKTTTVPANFKVTVKKKG